ncbi:MAG: hypothetical protein ACFFCQ_16510, partial [Promethearchaeota archaeon]
SFINAIPKLMKGIVNSLEWWLIGIPIAILAIPVPSLEPISATVKYTSLIVALTTYLAGFFIEYAVAQLNKFESFWYLMGAGIVSILTGYEFYKHGKAKIGPFDAAGWDAARKQLIEDLKKRAKNKIYALFDEIPKVVIMWISERQDMGGDETGWEEKLEEIWSDTTAFYNALKSWIGTFKTLDILSYGPTSEPSVSRDIKIFSGIVVGIGFLQIVIGVIALLNE